MPKLFLFLSLVFFIGCGGGKGEPIPIEEAVGPKKTSEKPSLEEIREDIFKERRLVLEKDIKDTNCPSKLKNLLLQLFAPYKKARNEALTEIAQGALEERDFYYFAPNRYTVRLIPGPFTTTGQKEYMAAIASDPADETFMLLALYKENGDPIAARVDYGKKEAMSATTRDVIGDGTLEIITSGHGASEAHGLVQRWRHIQKFNPELAIISSIWSGSEYRKISVPTDKHGKNYNENIKIEFQNDGKITTNGERKYILADGSFQSETLAETYIWDQTEFSYKPQSK